MRRTSELSIGPNIKEIGRLAILLLYLFLSFGLLLGVANSQCVAPTVGAAVPAAPTLDAQISVGTNYVTGKAIAGKTVVICVDGKQTDPATTVTVAQDGTFQAPMNVLLKAGQEVTAQQYTPGAAYSALSTAVTVISETDTCLETLQSGECQFRVQVDTSAAVGNGSQTNTSTTPNIMVTLDYQWHPPQNIKKLKALEARAKKDELLPQDQKALAEKEKVPRLAIHLRGRTGFSQTFAATNVQPTSTNGGANPPCPSSSQSPSSGDCMLAIPKPAFIAELGGRFGGTTAVDGGGFYGEFGVSGRGSFQYLVPTNQIVQNNGASYIDLSSTNPHNAVGFYEIMGYADVAQHDHTLATLKTENSSPLLVIEGGYQNNRALQQLLPASPRSSTRNRYVGRFTFNYEVSKATHSQISFGMEYSGGINGGPHVVQIFIGGNLNPAKLFGKNGP